MAVMPIPPLPEPPVIERVAPGPRELISVVSLVVLADAALDRGHGYTGDAALAAGIPLALAFGMPWKRPDAAVVPVSLLIVGVANVVLLGDLSGRHAA